MDLKDEPIMWTRRAPRVWVAGGPSAAPRRVRADLGAGRMRIEEMLEQVADGGAISISPSLGATLYQRPEISLRVPIADIEPQRIALAGDRGEESALVSSFAAARRATSRPSTA